MAEAYVGDNRVRPNFGRLTHTYESQQTQHPYFTPCRHGWNAKTKGSTRQIHTVGECPQNPLVTHWHAVDLINGVLHCASLLQGRMRPKACLGRHPSYDVIQARARLREPVLVYKLPHPYVRVQAPCNSNSRVHDKRGLFSRKKLVTLTTA